MARLGRLAAVSAALFGLADPVGAQPPPAAAPTRTPQEMVEWARNFVQNDGWVAAGASGGERAAVSLIPKRFVKGADGLVRTALRLELPQDQQVGGRTMRSTIQEVEFDCAGERMRTTLLRTFPAQNVTGNMTSAPGNNAWTEINPNSLLKQVRDRVCNTAVAELADEPPAPASRNRAAIFAWAAEAVDATGWQLSATSQEFILYSQLAPAGPGPREVKLRREYFTPQSAGGFTGRSEVITAEVDCAKQQARAVSTVKFARNNLKGEQSPADSAAAQFAAIPTEAGPMNSAGRVACPAAPSPNAVAALLGSPALTGAALAAKVAEAAKSPLGALENPVRVNGVQGERAYLDRLRCSDGTAPLYTRTGNYGIGVFGGIVDGYQLACATGAPREAAVYMDMYHPTHVEGAAPPGFTLAAGPTPTPPLPVPAVDQRAGRELVELFKAFCVDSFPDEAGLKTLAAGKNATALSRNEVKTYLRDDPGHGWRLRTALGLYVVTIEEPPFRTCAVRRMTPTGFTAVEPFAAVVQAAAAGRGALQSAPAQNLTSPQGLRIAVVPIVIARDGKPVEQYAVFQTAYAGKPPAEFAADAAGGQGVEVRIVRQLLN